MTSSSFDAIVLCGGAARRLGGTDKANVVVGGKTLLERAVDAVSGARRTIAVGPERDVTPSSTWTREEPAGTGPVAALAAGLKLVEEPVVVVLGVDFPFVDRACVDRLVESVGGSDGAIVEDDTGRHQFLVGAYRVARLEEALRDRDPRDMAVTDLMAGLEVVRLRDPRASRDCDTWDDVHAADASIGKETV